MERLFIYGTLGPGGPNEHVMQAIGGHWQPGRIKGRLRQAGWGAEMGFPGLVLDEAGDDIPGHVFVSDALPDHWAALDDFEAQAKLRHAQLLVQEERYAEAIPLLRRSLEVEDRQNVRAYLDQIESIAQRR